MDPQAPKPTVTKLISLPGHKRPSAWVVTETGRLAILRKRTSARRHADRSLRRELLATGQAEGCKHRL